MKRIFVPVDFSNNSKVAFRYAIELAKEFNSEIELFNAYSVPYSGSSVMIDISDVLESKSIESLVEMTEEINPESQGVKVKQTSIYGPAVETITKNSEGSDIIIMGTGGASGLSGRVLGSVASGVAKNVECPVIVLPEGSEVKLPKVATIATDLERIPHNEEYYVLNEIAMKFKVKLNVVYVTDDVAKIDKIKVEEQFNKNENPLSELEQEFFYVQDADVEDGIINHLANHRTDLLVVVARKRNFFERLFHRSVSRNITMHGDTPMLVIHE